MTNMSSPNGPNKNRFVLDPVRVLRQTGGPGGGPRDPLTEAHEQATELLAQTRVEAEEIRETAWREGYRKGSEDAAAEWKSILERVDAERASVVQQLEDMTEKLEKDIMKIALQVAEKIVRHDVDSGGDTVMHILRLALRQVKDRANVRIWVNKFDLERVRSARQEIGSWVDGLHDLEISEEPRVEPGGVIVECSDGVLDARPSTQIKEIQRRVEEAEPDDQSKAA